MDKCWCQYDKNEVDLFNRQLDNLQCKTLKDLCNLLIEGKLRRISDDEQVQVMNIQYQTTNLATAQVGQKFDFWKQVDEQFYSIGYWEDIIHIQQNAIIVIILDMLIPFLVQ